MSDIDIPNYQLPDYDLPYVRLGQGTSGAGQGTGGAGGLGVMYVIVLGNTTRPLLFLMGATGLSPVVTLSKNGGTFAAAAGAVSEIGNNWYAVAPSAADANAIGPLIVIANAAGATATTSLIQVAAADPFAPSGGGGQVINAGGF